MKQQEIDDIHHNIRNPLAIINLSVAKIMRTTGDCDTYTEVDRIASAVKRIDDFLKTLKSDECKEKELLAQFSEILEG